MVIFPGVGVPIDIGVPFGFGEMLIEVMRGAVICVSLQGGFGTLWHVSKWLFPIDPELNEDNGVRENSTGASNHKGKLTG